MGPFGQTHTAGDLGRDASGTPPQQPFPLESGQSSFVGRAGAWAGSPDWNNFGYRPVPVEDDHPAPGSHVIQIAAKPVPELGYPSHFHMAIMALYVSGCQGCASRSPLPYFTITFPLYMSIAQA